MARANALYYATQDPFADFTTAPEIAQMFGELLGAWAAVVWQTMGSPSPVALVEAGPGRGTLMADARRATARVAPAFHAACRVHLIETSPRLRAEQAARIPGATWHDTLDSLPPGPAIVLANEFLDALPIRQFIRTGATWTERHVQNGQFLDLPIQAALVPAREDWAQEDWARAGHATIHEINEPACAWVHQIAVRLAHERGAALILDYGPAESGSGDSLQAIRAGRSADPLSDPGTADLTAHVDFAALRRVAEAAGTACWGPVTQGAFLSSLGLTERTAQLAGANPHRAAALRDATARLAAPARMGTLFKALCLTHPGVPAPPGFAA